MAEIPLRTSVTGTGPGIVLAHGAGGTIDTNFGDLIPALAATHTVVASDYPGDDTPLELNALADALVAAADVPEFTIIGFSLGTAVAVRAAVRHPDRVRGLVLAAGLAKADSRARLVTRLWRDLLGAGDTDTFARLTTLVGFSADHIDALPDAEVAEIVRGTAASVPGGTVRQAELVEAADTTADLARLTVPTLVVNATADLLIHPSNSRALAAAIPGAEYTEIEAGHVLMAEQPDRWRETVLDFLARHGL